MKFENLQDALKPDGKPENKHELASLYFSGKNNGFPQNYVEAFKMFKQAADKGYAPSQYMSGLMMIRGQGAEKDLEAGFDLIKQASSSDNIAAVFYEANAYFDGKVGTGSLSRNYTHAFELYSKLADAKIANKNIAIQSNLRVAKIYLSGAGIEKVDPIKAISYLKKAANYGSREAAFSLANSYMQSNLPTKFEEAYKWTEKAFLLSPRNKPDAGMVKSLRDVGLMKYYGKGTEVDLGEAFRALETVVSMAKGGTPLVSYFLAKAYFEGEKTEKNIEKALEYLKIAASKYAPAALTYAILLEKGVKDGDKDMLTPDEFEAVKYYNVAAGSSEVAKTLAADLKNARKNRSDVDHGDVDLEGLMFANAEFKDFAEEEVPAKAEVEAPAKAEVEAPAKAEVEAPAKAEVEAPAKAEVEAPAKAEVEAPAKAEVEVPAKVEVEVPAKAEEVEAPAKAEVEAPAKVEAEVPAKAEVEAPAKAEVEAPAKAEVEAPAEERDVVAKVLEDVAKEQEDVQASEEQQVPTPVVANVDVSLAGDAVVSSDVDA